MGANSTLETPNIPIAMMSTVPSTDLLQRGIKGPLACAPIRAGDTSGPTMTGETARVLSGYASTDAIVLNVLGGAAQRAILRTRRPLLIALIMIPAWIISEAVSLVIVQIVVMSLITRQTTTLLAMVIAVARAISGLVVFADDWGTRQEEAQET